MDDSVSFACTTCVRAPVEAVGACGECDGRVDGGLESGVGSGCELLVRSGSSGGTCAGVDGMSDDVPRPSPPCAICVSPPTCGVVISTGLELRTLFQSNSLALAGAGGSGVSSSALATSVTFWMGVSL